MAPNTSATVDSDMRFLLHALVTCGPNINSKELAQAEGISRSDHAVSKLRRIIEKHGFSYKDKQVVKVNDGGDAAAETPKKGAATKKGQAKVPPKAKKRKLESDADEEVDVDDQIKDQDVEV